MKREFTERDRCSDTRTAKVKTAARNLFPALAVAWIMSFAALHVNAADNNLGNVKQAVGNTVWFGSYPQDYAGFPPNVSAPTVPYVLKLHHRQRDGSNPPQMRPSFFLIQPVKWRILANDAQGLLLIADEILDRKPLHETAGAVSWQASDLRDTLENRFLLGSTDTPTSTDYFTPAERNAVAISSLLNPTTGADPDGITTNDRVFLLSADEAETLFATDADRIGHNSVYAASYENTSDPHTQPDAWLTRTHSSGGLPGYAAFVKEDGVLDRVAGLKKIIAGQIRPALRLSRDAVVMVSNGVKTGFTDGSLKTTDILPASLLKLTLVDASLTLTSTSNKYPLVVPGGTLTLNYAGLSNGSGRYISCVIEEQGGDAIYYAKLDNASTASGTVTITVPSSTPESSYVLKLFCEEPNADAQAPDIASQPVVFNLGVSSAALAPTITTPTAPNGMVGLAYDVTFAATGNPAPVWEVATGTLPPGLTLEPTGQLHGTPVTAGLSYNFTLSATSGAGSAGRAYTVQIEATSAPIITGPAAGALHSQVKYTPYTPTYTITATGYPAPTFNVIEGAMPVGMTLNSTTGLISGIPTTEVNAIIKVEARNFLGIDIREYSIYIEPTGTPAQPSFITASSIPLPTAYAGQAYNAQIQYTGVPAPDIIPQVSLPAGLSIGTDGTISGTPPLSAAGAAYTIPIKLENIVGNITESFTLTIEYLLNRPALTLTPLITTTGSNPFTVTATFERPVSGLTDAHIAVIGGTASNVAMFSTPTSTTPPRANVWTFDVTPDPTNLDGTIIQAFVRQGSALDEYGAHTVSESDTVSVTYLADRPVAQFDFTDGQPFVSDPGGFSFLIHPYATTSTLLVDAVALSGTNIDDVIEIRRDGALVGGWDATVSGNTVTVTGVFGEGTYTVTLKEGRVSNDLNHYMGRTVIHFSVQISKNWYEGCTQTFTLAVTPGQLGLEYRGLAADYVVSPDGSPPPATLTVAAGATETAISLRSLRVPGDLEGGSGDIVITLNGAPLLTIAGLHFYNRPTEDDLVYIPPTTLYSGYLALLRGGSPYLQRSLDDGATWQNAWTPATSIQISNLGDAILFREPDGCYEIAFASGNDPSFVTVQRQITLPTLPGITTNPVAGEYFISSGADWVFQLTPSGQQYEGLTPEVSSGRQYVPDSVGVIVTPNGDGSFEVRIRTIREAVNISVRMVRNQDDGNASVEASRVWASGGQLYIAAIQTGEAKVYTLTGVLLRSIPVEAGLTGQTPLAPGFYIVTLSDGSRFKVSGF
jgi:hypothetical protein